MLVEKGSYTRVQVLRAPVNDKASSGGEGSHVFQYGSELGDDVLCLLIFQSSAPHFAGKNILHNKYVAVAVVLSHHFPGSIHKKEI